MGPIYHLGSVNHLLPAAIYGICSANAARNDSLWRSGWGDTAGHDSVCSDDHASEYLWTVLFDADCPRTEPTYHGKWIMWSDIDSRWGSQKRSRCSSVGTVSCYDTSDSFVMTVDQSMLTDVEI